MKKVIFLLIVLSSIHLHFLGKSEGIVPSYKIIFDSIELSIPKGKTLVTGTIFNNGIPLDEVTIISSQLFITSSNKTGKFRGLINSSSEKYLVVLKKTFATIYFENYAFQSQHHIHIEVYMPSENPSMIKVAEKPVIYCYSDIPLSFDLSLQLTNGNIAFTYPKIGLNQIWSMKIDENGRLLNNSGNRFPYLFWEGQFMNLTYQKADLGDIVDKEYIGGNIIAQQDIIPFLEENLSKLGLNSSEKTDFITYWGPRMVEHNYVLTQFLIDEAYDQIATINVAPQPDNLLRVYMLFIGLEKVPEHLSTLPQNFDGISPIKRNGFTILEWGGSELPLSSLCAKKPMP